MSVRIAVIGAGVVGRMRCNTIVRHPMARLVAVVDPDESAARRAASPAGARWAAHHSEVIGHPEVDVVMVSSPAPLHTAMVVEALQAGHDVLCEKPLATRLEDCLHIRQVARSCGRTLGVGFNHRYFPSFQSLKRAVTEGQLGQLQHVRALTGHAGLSEFRADWMYQSPLSGGGAMMDNGLHLTDLIRYLVGPIAEVYGTASNQVWNVAGSEDCAVALMKTESGLPIAYHATWGEWKGYRLGLEIYGTLGLMRASYAPMLTLEAWPGKGRGRQRWNFYPWINLREKLRGWETTAEQAFYEELDDFLRARQGDSWGALADADAGVASLQVAQALYQSQLQGQPVRPDSLVG